MVYKGLQSSFVSLSLPWSGRFLPSRGTSGSTGTLDWGPMWSGPQFSQHQLPDQPKVWKVYIYHMAGWLANCSWLSHKMSTWPPKQSILWPSVFPLWSGWPVGCTPPGKDILWPSGILLQVRLICLLKGKSGASGHSNSSSIYSIYNSSIY